MPAIRLHRRPGSVVVDPARVGVSLHEDDGLVRGPLKAVASDDPEKVHEPMAVVRLRRDGLEHVPSLAGAAVDSRICRCEVRALGSGIKGRQDQRDQANSGC